MRPLSGQVATVVVSRGGVERMGQTYEEVRCFVWVREDLLDQGDKILLKVIKGDDLAILLRIRLGLAL
jgi:hypothetical protein